MARGSILFFAGILISIAVIQAQDTLFPPQNLRYTFDCFDGTFEWDEPPTCDYTLLGYIYYSDTITEPEFVGLNTFKNFEVCRVIDTVHSGVSAIYQVKENIEQSVVVWKDTTVNFCNPPLNPEGTMIFPASRYTVISWDPPMCFSPYDPIVWVDDTIFVGEGDFSGTAFGITGNQEYSCAHLFPQESLTNYDSCRITEISFVPADVSANYEVCAWSGESYNTVLLHSQPVEEPAIGQWNTVILNDTVYFDITQDLWIGYHITSSVGLPAGLDSGPVVEGGDMIKESTFWYSFTTYNPSYDKNLSIKARIENDAERSVAFNLYGKEEPWDNEFEKINDDLIWDTDYYDGDKYLEYIYVTAVYPDCEVNSDTVATDYISGLYAQSFIEAQCTVYPQPATDEISVISELLITSLTILSIHGQFIMEINDIDKYEANIQLTNIPSGVYFLRLNSMEEVIYKKIIIQ